MNKHVAMVLASPFGGSGKSMEHRILFTTTITNLHIGAGQGIGAVDQPIARERATNWPVVPGSSLKGVLRDAARVAACSDRSGDIKEIDRQLASVFGATDDQEARAGSLVVTDQRIVLFPVRSFRGTFAYITCDLAVRRLCELMDIAGEGGVLDPDDFRLVDKDNPECIVHSESLNREGDCVYLEDLDLKCANIPKRDEFIEALAAVLLWCGLPEGGLKKRIVVVDNSTFSFLTEHATDLTTKVSLEFETKTAKERFLRTEESVPPEAVFAGLAIAQPMKQGDADKAIRHVEALDGHVMQFGAKASTGSGLCRLNVYLLEARS